MKENYRDSLLRAANAAQLGTGSTKTRINHLREAKAFIDALRALGLGVTKWTNITNRHVDAAVTYWQDRGLAPATIKEYLSGVRAVAHAYGNTRIAASNDAFGIGRRTYVTNEDRSMPQDVYYRLVEALKGGTPDEQRLAAQVMLARELGLRSEEARKFIPARDLLNSGNIYICAGTKGGRERTIERPTAAMLAAIKHAEQVYGRNHCAIPAGMREKQWTNRVYYLLRKHGISKDESNASLHGLRHAYAQERYRLLTGFAPRCRYATRSDYARNARLAAGDDWAKLDRDARLRIKLELGHGPDRDDVVSQYLGSATK